MLAVLSTCAFAWEKGIIIYIYINMYIYIFIHISCSVGMVGCIIIYICTPIHACIYLAHLCLYCGPFKHIHPPQKKIYIYIWQRLYTQACALWIIVGGHTYHHTWKPKIKCMFPNVPKVGGNQSETKPGRSGAFLALGVSLGVSTSAHTRWGEVIWHATICLLQL